MEDIISSPPCLQIPLFCKLLKYERTNLKRRKELYFTRLHLFAEMMAMYPHKTNEELSKEFLISPHTIGFIARLNNVRKSKETRSDINRRNHYARNKKEP